MATYTTAKTQSALGEGTQAKSPRSYAPVRYSPGPGEV